MPTSISDADWGLLLEESRSTDSLRVIICGNILINVDPVGCVSSAAVVEAVGGEISEILRGRAKPGPIRDLQVI